MKSLRYLVPGLAALLAAWAGAASPNASDSPNPPSPASVSLSDADLLHLASDLKKLTRVTEEPAVMDGKTAVLCTMPLVRAAHSALTPKGENALIHVFVTPDGAAAMKERTATFTAGTVILKQKFTSRSMKAPVLYTGMLKREKGFNPDCGDWEFFTLSGDAKTVTARGRLESCIKCHQDYPQSDFVTKNYLHYTL